MKWKKAELREAVDDLRMIVKKREGEKREEKGEQSYRALLANAIRVQVLGRTAPNTLAQSRS